MLVQYNIDQKNIQQGNINDLPCPNCKKTDGLFYAVRGGIVRIFFIPTAPMRKSVSVHCNNCQKTFKQKQLTPEIKQFIINERKKNSVKTPLWHFTGAFILFGLLTAAIYTGIQIKNEEKIFISQPKTGDVYYVHNETYTTYKVDEIDGDSVRVFLNRMETSDYNQLKDIDTDNNYIEHKVFAHQDLKKMFEDNVIYQIKRKE
ncbi:hypothetical protein KIH23_10605 [Flavobacterium sp. CYK-55]|uniref:hypothetical protein n=1 Tax=Flavobacterium sp. CYK-55 TaxID=2835529 RepID=UPI001BCE3C65|nr:hypothetical protein [Flavobacterium sp. CYK-55]MBS7787747.1 hypothetical protein [Flavobacterium sp. CYK-55]